MYGSQAWPGEGRVAGLGGGHIYALAGLVLYSCSSTLLPEKKDTLAAAGALVAGGASRGVQCLRGRIAFPGAPVRDGAVR
eukprot:2828745-Prymnesium_polylepis.1